MKGCPQCCVTDLAFGLKMVQVCKGSTEPFIHNAMPLMYCMSAIIWFLLLLASHTCQGQSQPKWRVLYRSSPA